MALILYFLLLFNINSAETQQEINEQAISYLQNIQNGQDVDLNFWALNEIYSSSCVINTQVQNVIQNSELSFLKKLFDEIACGTDISDRSNKKKERLFEYANNTGSLAIALNYLILEDNITNRLHFKKLFFERWEGFISEERKLLFDNVLHRNNVDFHFSTSKNDSILLFFLLTLTETHELLSKEDLKHYSKYFLSLKKDANPTLYSSIIEFSLIKTFYEIDDYKTILENFRGFTNSIYFPNSELKLRTLSGIDYSLYALGRFDESLFLQRSYSIPLATFYAKKEMLDDILLRQSSYLYRIGKYQEAKEILEELKEDSDFSGDRGQLLTNLSLCYLKLGEHKKYVSVLLDALPAPKSTMAPKTEYKVSLGIYRNLFMYYTSISDSLTAMPYMKKATKMATQQQDSSGLAAIHTDLGFFYWYLYHDTEKALPQYSIAEQIYEKMGDSYYRDKVLLSKSAIFTLQDSLSKATELLNTVKEKSLANADTPRYLVSLIGLAEIALKKNDFVNANEIFSQIKIYPLDNLGFDILTKYHSLRALYLSKQGLKREAFTYFEPVMEQVIERVKGTTDTQTGRWLAGHEYLDAFEMMIALLHEMGDNKKALEYLNQFKNINAAALYNSPLLRAAKLSEEDLIKDNALNNRIQALRSKYLSTSIENRLPIKAEIGRLSVERQQISTKISQVSEPDKVPIWRVQSQLNYNELLIHFTELNNKLYVSTISKTSIDTKIIKLNKENRALFEYAANSLAGASTSLNSLYKIYKILDFVNIPASVNRISVVPDNYLYRIPLDVLPTKMPNSDISFGSSHFMIEDFTFEYFTSLADYIYNNRLPHSGAKHDFSAFAISNFSDFSNELLPSLPYATQEVQQIEKTLSVFSAKNKNIYTGDNATKQNFTREIGESKIVHLATHSEVSEQDPLFSIIYLKNSEEDITSKANGNALYAYELFDSKLDNELIMLNSCSSGSGGYMQGTGIMGISRALKYAGAKSLALNIWSVNDHIASVFATDFYGFLNKGYSKSEAMRMAKINQLYKGNANPHYWGAYSLIGNPSAVTNKPANAIILYPVLLLLILLAGITLRKGQFY